MRVREDGLDGPGPWQVGENERTESFNGGNFALFEADGADKDRAMYFKSQVLKAIKKWRCKMLYIKFTSRSENHLTSTPTRIGRCLLSSV